MTENNVFKFYVYVNIDPLCINAYTRPEITDEKIVEDKFFTEERINSIKDYICDVIKNDPSALQIVCNDTDSNYDINENEILEI